MPESNAVFLSIPQLPPMEGAGFEIKILEGPEYNKTVGIIYDFVDFSFSDELSGVGQASVTLELNSPFWSNLLANGAVSERLLDDDYALTFYEEGLARFTFPIQKVEDKILEESQQHVVILSGDGAASTLKNGQTHPPNFPTYKKGVHWRWKNKPVMGLYRRLLLASKQRAAFPYIKMSFTDTKDSNHIIWDDTNDKVDELWDQYGIDLLEMLNKFTGQSLQEPANIRAEWHMRPDFTLDVKKTFGVDRSKTVIFYDGETFSKIRNRDREPIKNQITIQDNLFDLFYQRDQISRSKWGHREEFIARDDLSNRINVNKVVENILKTKKDEMSEWTIEVPYREAGYRPYIDYNLGDWVGIYSTDYNVDMVRDKFRVLAINISVDNNGYPTVQLTLQSKQLYVLEKLQNKIITIINQPEPNSDKEKDKDIRDDFDNNDSDDVDTGGDGDGGDSGDGIRVFIQPNEPADWDVKDFWLET